MWAAPRRNHFWTQNSTETSQHSLNGMLQLNLVCNVWSPDSRCMVFFFCFNQPWFEASLSGMCSSQFITKNDHPQTVTILLCCQTSALHQKLHPHASLRVLHAASCEHLRQGRGALLWICPGRCATRHGGGTQVDHRGSPIQQSTFCKCKPNTVLSELLKKKKMFQ